MKLPKIIHYCWFGGKPLDEKALRCIESWKKYFPDYEIIQWNEQNFDINRCDFMRKAYDARKWAFVSDVARLMVIYDHGGIYFDTDVEVVAPYDDILASDADGFLGLESTMCVNSGLGFGAIAHNQLIQKLIEQYQTLRYEDYSADLSQIACTVLTTDVLLQQGFAAEDRKQRISGFDIYPTTYFSPIDYYTGKLRRTEQTHSIHWYNASWLNEQERKVFSRSRHLAAWIGRTASDHIWGIADCIKREGFTAYIRKRINKYILKK